LAPSLDARQDINYSLAIFNLNEDGAPSLDRFLGHFTKPSGT